MIDFPKGEHTYEVKSTGSQDYHGVCGGVQIVKEDIKKDEIQ
jgi:hypothetical protein